MTIGLETPYRSVKPSRSPSRVGKATASRGRLVNRGGSWRSRSASPGRAGLAHGAPPSRKARAARWPRCSSPAPSRRPSRPWPARPGTAGRRGCCGSPRAGSTRGWAGRSSRRASCCCRRSPPGSPGAQAAALRSNWAGPRSRKSTSGSWCLAAPSARSSAGPTCRIGWIGGCP